MKKLLFKSLLAVAIAAPAFAAAPARLYIPQENASWAKYESEKKAAIWQAIKDHDYDVIRKEVPSFANTLNEQLGESCAQNFLTDALNEAIDSSDLTTVKMITTAESKRDMRKVLNPGNIVGPQGLWSPLWHSEMKRGSKKDEDEAVFQYLSKLAQQEAN